MADLILLPTLERLHPYDDTTAKLVAFGLTFSVALGKDRTPVPGSVEESFLKPWDWRHGNLFRPIEQVYLFSLGGAK